MENIPYKDYFSNFVNHFPVFNAGIVDYVGKTMNMLSSMAEAITYKYRFWYLWQVNVKLIKVPDAIKEELTKEQIEEAINYVNSGSLLLPCIILRKNDSFSLVYGFLTYKILSEMGYEKIPCFVGQRLPYINMSSKKI